ncbi:MAG: hypothetical protein NTW38_13060 [Candidatus Aminicenantes bacterium]|nr:hypothetical protein [Candidatus Aminicenantes bacterium]
MKKPRNNLERADQVYRVFDLLGVLLSQRTSDHISLVVCGGSALISLGLVSRATKDVDVVALLDRGTLVSAETMSPVLIESAHLVSLELGLPEDWLNSGPTSILNENLPNQGFPVGFQDRLTRRDFGPVLSVYFISRYDQIHFKLYAAADQGGPSSHLIDLVGLKPSDDELLAAVAWARLHDVSPAFLETVRSMLDAMERRHVLARL